jgi:hypothetical protein
MCEWPTSSNSGGKDYRSNPSDFFSATDVRRNGPRKTLFSRRNEMKTLAYVLFGFVSIFCLTGMVSSKAEASEYLGEFCWTDESGAILKLGASHIGDEHYLLSGHITDDGNVYPIHGNAEIEGNNILVSLNGSKKGESWSYNITLNIFTFNGTYDRIKLEHHPEDQPIEIGDIFIDSDIQYSTGSLTFTSCP